MRSQYENTAKTEAMTVERATRWLAALTLVISTAVSANEQRVIYDFDVSLDDSPLGTHRFTVEHRNGATLVQSHADFAVKFLFIDAYSYEHRSEERWTGGCIDFLKAETSDNGERSTVDGQRSGDSFKLVTGEATTEIASDRNGCVSTYSYWDVQRLERAPLLLNPQTGEYEASRVTFIGNSMVPGIGRIGQKYLLTVSSRKIALWYDGSGEWLALETSLPNGKTLRYGRRSSGPVAYGNERAKALGS